MPRFVAIAPLAGVLFAFSGCTDALYAVRGTVAVQEGAAPRPIAVATVELSAPPGRVAPSSGPSCTGLESKAATGADGEFLVVQDCYGVLGVRCAPCVVVVSAPGYKRQVVEFRGTRSGSRPCPPEKARVEHGKCREIDVVLRPAAPSPR